MAAITSSARQVKSCDTRMIGTSVLECVDEKTFARCVYWLSLALASCSLIGLKAQLLFCSGGVDDRPSFQA